MSEKFNPIYIITPSIAQCLMRIEAAKEAVVLLPVNQAVLASLRETAKLYTTHYSTMIEGNRLTVDQVKQAVMLDGHFPERERDEQEVRGYYAALAQLEEYVGQARLSAISYGSFMYEDMIALLHTLVMSGGKKQGVKKSSLIPYRDGQNVIRDGMTGAIVYMPSQAQDVSLLMNQMMEWIKENDTLPCPIVAAIAHYQFATIHPYYDGNGRTARLLTTLILHLGGYDLKGLYLLEEYYAKNLPAYYQAIDIGLSHNYYLGRAESDITQWIEYFMQGMAFACEKVVNQMTESHKKGQQDQVLIMRTLDLKQRKILELFKNFDVVTSGQVGEFFGFNARVSSQLCKKWVQLGFLQVVDPSKKSRTYRLADQYYALTLA